MKIKNFWLIQTSSTWLAPAVNSGIYVIKQIHKINVDVQNVLAQAMCLFNKLTADSKSQLAILENWSY